MASVHQADARVHSDAPFLVIRPSFIDPDEEFGADDMEFLLGVEPGSPMFGPDDAPGIPTMPFDAWIELQASILRSHGTDAASWLAGRLDQLAETARTLRATTPAEFDGREQVMEDDARDAQRAIGWSECERRFEPMYPLF